MNKQIMGWRAFFVAATLSCLGVISAPAVAVPGSTQGHFSVGSTGAAQYAVPLTLPPGIQGVMPNLSLQYSSQGDNGLLGVGWSLGGLATINRCPQTMAQDGARAAVTLTLSDRFCLNGKRLILVSGIYGANGAEYRTEMEEFSRIVSYTSVAVRGPEFFKVWTKDGYVLELGNTTDSKLLANQTGAASSSTAPYGYVNTVFVTGGQIVLQWNVNKVSDRKSNYYTITYTKEDLTGEIYPNVISYTGNEAAGLTLVSPSNRVDFVYEARPALADQTLADYPRQYLGGSRVSLGKRLQEISVSGSGVVARKYKLAYKGVAAWGGMRSHLDAVTECTLDAAGTESCYPPTRFDVSALSACMYDSYQSDIATAATVGAGTYIPMAQDFDGDGRTDLVSAKLDEAGFRVLSSKSENAVPSGTDFVDTSDCKTAKKQGQSFGVAIVSTVTTTNHGLPSQWELTAGDVTGDGLPEVVAIPLLGVLNPVVAVRQASGAYALAAGSPADTSDYSAATAVDPYGGKRAWLMDINGDGRQDLVAIRLTSVTSSNTNVSVYYRQGVGDGTFAQTVKQNVAVGGNESPLGFSSFAGDVNGDGRMDLVFVRLSGGVIKADVLKGNGAGTIVFQNPVASLLINQAKFDNALASGTVTRINLLDVNRDGLSDLVFFKLLQGTNKGAVLTALASQDGSFIPPDASLAYVTSNALISTPSDPSTIPWQTSFSDIDGDGRTDLFVTQVLPDLNYSPAKNRLLVYTFLNRGDGRFHLAYAGLSTNAAAPSLASETNWRRVSGDFDGDGLGDLASVIVNDTNGFATYPIFARGPLQGLLTQVTDGHGATTQIVQAPLTRDEVYTKGAATSPQIAIRAALYVVKSVTRDAGNGLPPAAWAYTYANAKVEPSGRGFVGFASRQVTDPQGIVTTTRFSQTFPYIGMATDTSSVKDGITLSTVANTLDQKVLTHASGKTTYYPFVSRTVASQHEYSSGGALVSQADTSYSLDSWGNPLSATATITGDGNTYTQVATNTYFANLIDATTWRIGEISQKAERRVGPLPGGATSDLTRTVAYTYDGAGLMATEDSEPANAALRVLTSVSRDRFGNVLSTTVTGAGIEPRTESATFDASGRFVASKTNALNQVITPIVTDARFGLPLSVRDPNGTYAVRQYDGFGRVLREQVKQTHADGSVSDGHYTDTAYLPCDTDGSCVTAQGEVFVVRVTALGAAPIRVYYDRLGRERRKVAKGMDGRDIITATEYDAQGRVVRSSKPYFASGAGATPQWTTRTYDAVGRLSSETQPGGRTSTYTYGARVVSVHNPKGQISQQAQDALGRLSVTTNAENQQQTFHYDAFGRVVRSTDAAGSIIANQYDLLGRKTQQIDPDLGTWNYLYNELGELIWQQDAKGQITTFTYDRLGRPLVRSEPDLRSTWTWDTASNGIGKLAKLTGDNGFERTYSYDGFGRAIQTATNKSIDPYATAGDPNFIHSTGYDSAGRPLTITYPTGFGYKNVYDANGYLSEVRHKDTNDLYWRANARDAEGRVTRETLGNGFVTNRQYKADSGYLDTVQTGIVAADGTLNATVQNDAYSFDAIGNLTTRSQYFGSTSLTESFTYDSLNRLRSATPLGGTSVAVAYYANGNVHARTDVGTYGYTGCGGTHRVCYVGFSNFSYDANGNMLSGNGRSMTWSSANYPLTITKGASTEQFLYTPERERVRRISVENGQTTTTVYLNPRIDLGNTFEKTYSPVGAVTYTHHVYAGGQVVGSVNTGPAIAAKTHYFHVDHLGSLTAVTDASGTVVERLSYDAWGKRRKLDSGRDTCNVLSGTYAKRGFTLHEHLDGVDLVHMNGRVYDPLIGRFLSADPNVFYPENQQDFNRYSYVHNNPLSFVDPSGFSVALEDWEMSGYGVGMEFDQLQYAIANSSFQTMNNYYAYGNITNSYTTGTVTVSGIQSTAASNQYGAASVNTGNTGASSGSASTGGSALGNLARNIPVLGGMLGSVADVASGFLNVVAGAASFGLSGTLSHGIGQMGYGATQMGDILGRDILGLGAGVAGTLYTTARDAANVATLGQFAALGNRPDLSAPRSPTGLWGTLQRFVLDAIIPDYGMFGGANWGIDTAGRRPGLILNQADFASYQHDLRGNEAQWVRDAFSTNPSAQGVGPIGAAYSVLGGIVFGTMGLIEGEW